MPKDRKNKISCNHFTNEVELTLEVLSGKWKVLILFHLQDQEVIRYNEFRKLLPTITQKMLTQQLRDLEENGLIFRTVYHQIPPMVEYQLTDMGKTLIPVLETMGAWGKSYLEQYRKMEEEEHTEEEKTGDR